MACIFAGTAQLKAEEAAADLCTFHVLADDGFALSINGKELWSDKSYDKVVKKDLPLKKDDVVSLIVTDRQGGRDGMMAILITRGDDVVATSKNFRYSVEPAEDFATAKEVKKLTTPEWGEVDISFGLGKSKQPAKAWTRKSDRDNGVVHFRWLADKPVEPKE